SGSAGLRTRSRTSRSAVPAFSWARDGSHVSDSFLPRSLLPGARRGRLPGRRLLRRGLPPRPAIAARTRLRRGLPQGEHVAVGVGEDGEPATSRDFLLRLVDPASGGRDPLLLLLEVG